MNELISNAHNSIGFEIELEAKRRVSNILEGVAAGKTTIQAEINKRSGTA